MLFNHFLHFTRKRVDISPYEKGCEIVSISSSVNGYLFTFRVMREFVWSRQPSMVKSVHPRSERDYKWQAVARGGNSSSMSCLCFVFNFLVVHVISVIINF